MSNNRHSQNTTLREEKTIPCNCGQNTHLIRLPDGWHYHKIHGTNESLSNGRCFNCRVPLDMSLAVDIFIVPNHPYWTDQERIFQEDKVWYEAKPDEITAIRKKVPGWTPDNPQWSEVKAKLLKISNISIRFADCKDMKFGDISAIFRNESEAEQPEEMERNATLDKIRAWLKKHPHSYGLIGGAIFLILFFILGLFRAQWRNWCWGTAVISLLVLILSLLGGRTSR